MMTNGSILRVALTGDSIVERRLLTREDATVQPLFDLIRNADIAFTNLEVLPNDFVGDPVLESGGAHFGAPAWVLDELTEAGFRPLCHGNQPLPRLRHLRIARQGTGEIPRLLPGRPR